MSTPTALRPALVNATRRERAELVVPPGLDLDLPLVGWRDRKAPLRAFLVRPSDSVGLVLRSTTAPMSARINALCDLCRTPRSGDEVSLFVARRPRRDADSVGYYVCDDLDCGVQTDDAEGLLRRFALFVAAVDR